MKKSSKYKCWGICTLVTGCILLAIGITLPVIMPSLVEMGAKDAAPLRTDNMKQWAGIPGPLDLGVYKKNFVYECTNKDDVIYKGARPIMRESEPYLYREHDDYGDFNFT